MKRLLLVFFVISAMLKVCAGQEIVRLSMEHGYRVEGVIFPETEHLMFRLKNDGKLFNARKDQITKAEGYLLNNRPDVKYVNMTDWFEPAKLKQKLKGQKRQYLGYVANKDTIIFIQTLDFRNRKEAKEDFDGWEKQVIVAFGSFAEANTRRFEVNLTAKTVAIY